MLCYPGLVSPCRMKPWPWFPLSYVTKASTYCTNDLFLVTPIPALVTQYNIVVPCLPPSYLCRDMVTCLDSALVCDGTMDCPGGEELPGGEDEMGGQCEDKSKK